MLPHSNNLEPERLVLNMGPQHPSTHGVLRLILELEGEVVKSCRPEIGYLHTGVEKECEYRNYNQIFMLIDRLDYLSAPFEELAYVLAVERLLGLEVPKRAQYVRVLLCELCRIASHLVYLGTSALEVNMSSVFMYCFRDREQILDIFELVSGARMFPAYFRIGGLAFDLPEGFQEEVQRFLQEFPPHLQEYHRLMTKNLIWLERTRGIGKLSLEDCKLYGVTGPLLRAAGVPYDIRKAFPYSSYEEFEFEIPKAFNSDAYDRYLVRMAEMEESLKIIEQALEKLPEGPFIIQDPKITKFNPREGLKVPPGEVYASVESPRGELGYYLVSDGSNKPYRLHVRSPSFAHVQALPKMIEGGLIADAVVAIASLDPVLGSIDR